MKDAAPANYIGEFSRNPAAGRLDTGVHPVNLNAGRRNRGDGGKAARMRLRGDMAGLKATRLAVGLSAGALAVCAASPAFAQDSLNISVQDLPAIGAVGVVIVIMSVLVGSILTSSRLRGSSLFNRLFIVVAVSSGFFSGLMYQAHQDSTYR